MTEGNVVDYPKVETSSYLSTDLDIFARHVYYIDQPAVLIEVTEEYLDKIIYHNPIDSYDNQHAQKCRVLLNRLVELLDL